MKKILKKGVLPLIVILVLCCLTLSATACAIIYKEPIKGYEVLLLVDLSHSNKASEEKKNEFIKEVLETDDSAFLIGIVTFGKNQVHAAEFSYDADKVYDDYLKAPRPDDTATNIAEALIYAKNIFTNPATAKIVLITDGIETDGSANSAVLSLVVEGIQIDAVYFPDEYDDEVQFIGVVLPDDDITAGDEISVGVTVQSSYTGDASITLFDNGIASPSAIINVKLGIETFYFEHTFDTPGLHELRFEITSPYDTLIQNNTYYAFLNLESIPPQGDIEADFIPDNYGVQLYISTSLTQDETLEVTITYMSDPMDTTADQFIIPETYGDNFRCVLKFSEPGVYEVRVQKKNSSGDIIAKYITYYAFSYSAEYNVFADSEKTQLFLENLALYGRGNVISEAQEIFKGYALYIEKTYSLPFFHC